MIINEFRSPCPPEQQYTVCYKIAFVLLFQRKKKRDNIKTDFIIMKMKIHKNSVNCYWTFFYLKDKSTINTAEPSFGNYKVMNSIK